MKVPNAQSPRRLTSVVFAHDNVFARDEDGRVFSRGAWHWYRYTDFADEVVVASRMEPLHETEDALDRVDAPGVRFVAVPSLSGPVARFTNRARAREVLEEALGRADALVARLPSEIGAAAVAVAKRRRVPWAVEIAGSNWNSLWNYGNWQGRVYAPYAELKMRKLVRQAPFALYVTDAFLQQRYPSRGRTIGCSDVHLPPSDPALLERRLERIDRTPLRIGLIGYLAVRYKGIATALRALASVMDELPPFEFTLLGYGDSRYWHDLARQHGLGERLRTAAPRQSGQPVLDWLDDIDLYLHPTLEGGLPRALIEAMSRACPALGSTAGGIPELLDPSCLHRPGDERELAALLVRAADPAWRREQATRNFEKSRRFSRDRLDPIRSGFWADFVRHATGAPRAERAA